MPINPQHEGSFTYQDYSKEKSEMGFYFGPITALTIAAFLTDFGNLRTATNNIVLGTLTSDKWTGDATKYNNAPPSNVDAQRERKFLVNYQGNTTFSKYKVEIPTADLITARMIPGTDMINLTETNIAAWITAFQTLCKTPEGEAVTVISIQAVGRST